MLDINEILNALIIQISEGNVRAVNDFYRLSYKELYRVAIGLLKNRDLAEDAVAQIFANLHSICDRFSVSLNPWKCVLREQKRICRVMIRHNKKKGIIVNTDKDTTEYWDADSQMIKYMYAELDEDEQDVIEYHLYFDYPFKKIAQLKSMDIKVVKRIYNNALHKMDEFYRRKY